MARVLLFLAGCGLIVTGVAWVSPWFSLVIGGTLLCILAVLLEKSAVRRETRANQ